MSDDITQKLRTTMPDFKGIEISCPCRIRSSLMREAADEIEKLTRERDEARSKETDYGEGFEEGWIAAQKGAAAEVERLRAEIKTLYNAGGMTRAALGSWAGDSEPTHKRVAAVVAEVEKLRAQIALRVPEAKP